MYVMKKRRKKIKQKGGFFMLPYLYQMKKLTGKGIRRKKNIKKKRQKGGFFGWKEIWS